MKSNRLCIFPDDIIAVPSRYCGTVDYYAAVASFGASVVMTGARYDKRQKDVHRTLIADVNGPLRLTVPTSRPAAATSVRWSDITVSSHGGWADVHRTALESAYGRTPYFEFYAPGLLPLLVAGNQPVVELNAALDAEIRRILMLPPPLAVAEATVIYDRARYMYQPVPYYQVRAAKLGFIPHLSILDLIFSMGPESPLVLKKMINLSHSC